MIEFTYQFYSIAFVLCFYLKSKKSLNILYFDHFKNIFCCQLLINRLNKFNKYMIPFSVRLSNCPLSGLNRVLKTFLVANIWSHPSVLVNQLIVVTLKWVSVNFISMIRKDTLNLRSFEKIQKYRQPSCLTLEAFVFINNLKFILALALLNAICWHVYCSKGELQS